VSALDPARARLVSGPLGRGTAFIIDFAVAVTQGIRGRVRALRS
jgi:hypothetical protein